MTYLYKAKKLYRALILFWTAFIGVGAMFGSVSMLIAPDGSILQMQAMLPYFAKMPFADILFQDYVFAGISLLIVNGISNLTAFTLILLDKKAGYILGFIFGITLMLWICIQFWLFAPEVYAIDVAFFLFGLAQLICGYLAYVNFRQREFDSAFNAQKSAVTNGAEAVVFFSRMGYTKSLAAKKAAERGCALIELETNEPTRGYLGFWWCGRFAMHGWGMKLKNTEDLSKYDKIYIFCPVWAFSICAPVRELLKTKAHEMQNVDFTAVHFMRADLKNVFTEPKSLLGDKLTNTHSVCCRFGRTR